MKGNIKSNSFLTACCDKVSHTTALKKGAVLNRWKEQLGKFLHLSKTNSHDCSLGIFKKPTEYKEQALLNLQKIKSLKLTFVLFPISKPSTKPVPFGFHYLVIH